MPRLKINYVPDSSRSKILAKIKELSDLLNESGVSIILNEDSGVARLLPSGFSLKAECECSEEDTFNTFITDEFEFIDIPVILYEPDFDTITRDN